jgi:DNA-directed RNA polymerase specialized sigma24 family protein
VVSRHHRSASRLRRLVDRVILGETDTGQPAIHPPGQEHERLLAALGGLRPRDREALLLLYWEELSYAEAATALGCSANAVGIRVHRAKARLREALEAGAPAGAEPVALSLDRKRGC